jgi:hypothetical protein
MPRSSTFDVAPIFQNDCATTFFLFLSLFSSLSDRYGMDCVRIDGSSILV